MKKKQRNVMCVVLGLVTALVVAHVVTVIVNARVAAQALTLKMTEADVVAALGRPTQASDWFTADHAVTGRKLEYHFPFLWDRLLERLPERLRYYNPAWVTADFRQHSRTVSEILRHDAYQRGAIVVQKANQQETSNKASEATSEPAPSAASSSPQGCRAD